MQLSDTEAELVRASFAGIARESAKAADIFYRRLFALAPQVRPLFIGDLNRQGAMLMSTLGIVVAQLQNWDELAPVVKDLGLRHVAYGVKPEHYAIVGEALLAMLDDMSESGLPPEVEAAWAKAYTALATYMVSVSYQ